MGDVIRFPIPTRQPLPRRRLPAINRRLAEIGRALELPEAETARAGTDFDTLLAFARRHNQSLDWICAGDPGPMIRRLQRRR
jgi:hypothetical protein